MLYTFKEPFKKKKKYDLAEGHPAVGEIIVYETTS